MALCHGSVIRAVRLTATCGTSRADRRRSLRDRPTDLDALARRVQEAIDAHIAAATLALSEVGDEITPLVDAVSRLLAGGKGLRAGFLYWGYRAAGGKTPTRWSGSRRAWSSSRGRPCCTTTSWIAATCGAGMPSAHRAVAGSARLRAGPATAHGSARPRRSSPATSASPGADELYSTCGLPPSAELDRGRGTFDTHAHPADGRPVPRPPRVGPRVGPARHWIADRQRPQRDSLQEREVHHRAPVPHRRSSSAALRRLRSGTCPTTASHSARRSSCAMTCSVSSGIPRRPGSLQETTCARASAPSSSPLRSTSPETRTARRSRHISAARTSTMPGSPVSVASSPTAAPSTGSRR